MVTVSFKIQEIDGTIACHQKFEDEGEVHNSERAIGMLLVKKVAELIPAWLKEVTGCDVNVEDTMPESLQEALESQTASPEAIVKKLTELAADHPKDWKDKLKEVMDVIPDAMRKEIQTKMQLLGDTFDISKEFGPLNRVYEQDE